MAIGMRHAMVTVAEKAAKERTYQVAQEFLRRFAAEQGSTDCRVLLGYDMSIPEQLEKVHAGGLTKTTCPPLVSTALRLLAEMGIV